MVFRVLAVAIFAAVSACAAAAQPEGTHPVIVKIRLLFRDPESRQPKYKCPEDSICLRYPNSFTVDVREVLAGNHLPRRAHAILWFHTFPSNDTDLLAGGIRLASGDIDVYEWRFFDLSGCAPPPDEPIFDNASAKKIEELRLAGRLPCKSVR